MNKVCGWLTVTLVAAGVLVASPAHAVLVDFTDSASWSAIDGTASHSAVYAGVTVTVSTSPGSTITFNAAQGGDPLATCGATGLACQGDGFGVNGNDEIGLLPDQINVHFSTPVALTGIRFLDLFGVNPLVGDNPAEVAQWVYLPLFGLSTPASPDGTATGIDTTSTLGYLAVNVGPGLFVSDITFYAVGPLSPFTTDFALAAVEFDAAPEPATLALLGTGLAAIGLRLRRRRR